MRFPLFTLETHKIFQSEERNLQAIELKKMIFRSELRRGEKKLAQGETLGKVGKVSQPQRGDRRTFGMAVSVAPLGLERLMA